MSEPIETTSEYLEHLIALLDEFIPGIRDVYDYGSAPEVIAWYVNVWGVHVQRALEGEHEQTD